MKHFQLISLLNGLFLFSNVCAVTLSEGLTNQGKQMIHAAVSDFNLNNSAIGYGTVYAGETGSYAVEASINVQQFLQEMYPEKLPQSIQQFIEVTPMIGVNDMAPSQAQRYSTLWA